MGGSKRSNATKQFLKECELIDDDFGTNSQLVHPWLDGGAKVN